MAEINFGVGKPVTVSERGKYSNMKEMSSTFRLDSVDLWKENIDFKKDGFKEMSCKAFYGSDERDFICIVKGQTGLQISGFKLGTLQRVHETRYGDIDGDKDIDIAVKLTDGAIYVFHNLSK